MAEGYFNHLARQKRKNDLLAISAGLAAGEGYPAAELSRALSAEDGIDISRHQSQRLRRELVERSFLILTMTGWQKEETLETFPAAQGKTYTLKEFSGGSGDIEDPIGLDREAYQGIYREIKEAVDHVFRRVSDEDRAGK